MSESEQINADKEAYSDFRTVEGDDAPRNVCFLWRGGVTVEMRQTTGESFGLALEPNRSKWISYSLC